MKGIYTSRVAGVLSLLPVLAFGAGELSLPRLPPKPAAVGEVGPGVSVEVTATASSAERLAARELQDYLHRMYPEASGKRIRLQADLPVPEGYEITGTADEAVIRGGGPRGVLYGAYALLEKLGCRFYLNSEVVPPPSKDPLSFAGLKLSNRPLASTRLVLNWHNYLTGLATWNRPDWQQYIAQTMKMGFNTFMVHTYGNNPADAYSFNGTAKICGWVPSTRTGRDWHTPHVNDVRRMIGGANFDQPVFGSEAAFVPDEQRSEAIGKLMRQGFDMARERGMEVLWALDVDTVGANPQDLIGTLPPEACLKSRRAPDAPAEKPWLLANPEHPEGYRFYQAHAEQLLRHFPQITCLALWFRMNSTPWLNLPLENMPATWQAEYRKATADTPAGQQPVAAHEILGIVKIAQAYRRALDEMGRSDVRLAVGSWNFNHRYLAALEAFLPREMSFIGLDYNIHHLNSTLTAVGKDHEAMIHFAARRPLIFVTWAQGDDAAFFGRGFTPFPEFSAKLAELKISGYGIKHWATRPYDLFFANMSRQVWAQTRNEALQTTCGDMAEHLLGDKRLGGYLKKWATEAPTFGTAAGIPVDGLRAVNQKSGSPEPQAGMTAVGMPVKARGTADEVLRGLDQRLRLLGKDGNVEVGYYRNFETHTKQCTIASRFYDRATELMEQGEWDKARGLLAECRPEKVIEAFADTRGRPPLNRGELGQLALLNLQWRPTIMRARQILGLEPIRIRYAPTWREGGQTRFIDEAGKLWDTVGDYPCFTLPQADMEIGRNGLQCATPTTLSVQPIKGGDYCPDMYQRGAMKEGLFCPGNYRLRLLLLDPDSTAPGQRVFTIAVWAEPANPSSTPPPVTVDVFQQAGGSHRLVTREFTLTLAAPGQFKVKLTPVKGKAVLSGWVLERVGGGGANGAVLPEGWSQR